MKETRHPEASPGEVWLTNIYPELDLIEGKDSYRDIEWRTKRRGMAAYGAGGDPIPGAYPVFVSRAELAGAGVVIEDA